MEGSLSTMPCPCAKTQVLAVPRSIAISVEKRFMDALAHSMIRSRNFCDLPGTHAAPGGENYTPGYFLRGAGAARAPAPVFDPYSFTFSLSSFSLMKAR